jgi:hypothetical protein
LLLILSNLYMRSEIVAGDAASGVVTVIVRLNGTV